MHLFEQVFVQSVPEMGDKNTNYRHKDFGNVQEKILV